MSDSLIVYEEITELAEKIIQGGEFKKRDLMEELQALTAKISETETRIRSAIAAAESYMTDPDKRMQYEKEVLIIDKLNNDLDRMNGRSKQIRNKKPVPRGKYRQCRQACRVIRRIDPDGSAEILAKLKSLYRPMHELINLEDPNS